MASQLARELPGSVCVFDPKPHERRSPWRTYRWCLERALLTDWTHLLVLQDDTRLCRDFELLLPRVVAAQPDSLLVLFCAAVPVQSARAIRNACWYDLPFATLNVQDWVPVVATVWPVKYIRPALAWVDRQRWPAEFVADDEITGRVARALGLTVYATAPSLVEHPDEAQPVNGGRRPLAGRDENRVAYCFAGDDHDLLDVDWTAGVFPRDRHLAKT